MKWLLIAAILVIAAVIIARQKGLKTNGKYHAKKPLTNPEQIMYFKLKKALPEHEILAQVPFSRFLYTKGGTKEENWTLNSKARQKISDFLICNKDFSVIAAVEIDDSSHNKTKDEQRDEILKQAGIPTIRWNVKQLPTEQQIADQVKAIS